MNIEAVIARLGEVFDADETAIRGAGVAGIRRDDARRSTRNDVRSFASRDQGII